MNRFRLKMQEFMRGRYGMDQFNKFLYWASLVLLILSFIFGGILYIIAVGLLIYSYFRMLSRNYQARYRENLLYMGYANRVKSFINTQKLRFRDRRTHHIYRCPQCKQNIRIPKGKGRICVTCPRCKHEFIKVS